MLIKLDGKNSLPMAVTALVVVDNVSKGEYRLSAIFILRSVYWSLMNILETSLILYAGSVH